MNDITEPCIQFMSEKYPKYLRYWTLESKEALCKDNLISYCDVLYSLFLLNWPVEVQKSKIVDFIETTSTLKLYGTKLEQGEHFDCSCHLSAYLLGTVQILRKEFPNFTSNIELKLVWDFQEIIDENYIPKFPAKFTHHSWRVSHWLGGVPSIILNVYRETNDVKYKELLDKVLSNIESKAINDQGLIKVHKSDFLHKVFRTLYQIKHSPKIGDIGGIVHILWIYHYLGKQYKSNDKLLGYALSLIDLNKRFIEDVPYCLDFDFIQLIRTASDEQQMSEKELEVFTHFKLEIEKYFQNELILASDFTLHKLPGALATLVESEIALHAIRNEEAKGYSDIIKTAAWL